MAGQADKPLKDFSLLPFLPLTSIRCPLDAKSSSISTFPSFRLPFIWYRIPPRCASCVKCFPWRSSVWKHNDGGGTLSHSLFLSWQLGFFEMSRSKKMFSMESWWEVPLRRWFFGLLFFSTDELVLFISMRLKRFVK